MTKKTGRATVAAGSPEWVPCENCGADFQVRPNLPGRRKRYCSPACRTQAFRAAHAPSDGQRREDLVAAVAALRAVDLAAIRTRLSLLDGDTLAELGRHAARLCAAVLPPEPVVAAAAVDPLAQDTLPFSVTPTAATENGQDAPAPPVSVPARGMTATVGGLKPTGEQQAIIDACVAGQRAAISAGAGTGKTATLRMAATLMRGRGLYVAFNRAIAADAKKSFPKHVSCSTAHSLAFRAIGHQYKARLDGPRLPAHQCAALLGIDTEFVVSRERNIEAPQLARLAMETVAAYCRTADEQLDTRHVPQVNGVDGPAAAALAEHVLPYAIAAWADLRRLDGRLKFTHDHYLKMWALGRPQLAADFILFDEAQDADPLIASVVQDQQCQLIAVGDENQAIYGWRGAVDALSNWPADLRLRLSRSWRFGPAVADEANKWLTLLNARLRLTGSPTLASRVEPLEHPKAILCRTNAEAMGQAMSAMDDGHRAGLVGGGATIRRLAEAAERLQHGRKTDHPELFAFATWAEVQEYTRNDHAGKDLAVFVRLIDDYGAPEIIHAADRLSDERYADLVISTAHKAKGREWDTVQIGGDFRQPAANDNGTPGRVPKAEAMLAYVAVTRAQQILDRGGLAWIDDQLAGATNNQPRTGRRRHLFDDDSQDY
ncbi:UvrD-helicase domain-containing protein [Salinispora mooreana]|uniref:UvrD-helicase domain-containing protein n=1 Tax=Salinispora mooreana TaxID=999545 RepID=UPI001CC818FD|nr:UvrD-helicase domain-containing protein [Salinispora mooreana]